MRWSLSLAGGLATGALGAVSPASAATFTAVVPATCPATTEVDWKYNLSAAGTGEWMVASDPNAPSNYISNVNYTIGLAANSRVNQFGVRVDAFATELNFDFLRLTSNSGPTLSWNNRPATGWYDWHTNSSNVPVSSNVVESFLTFTSDINVTDTGIAIGRARVCTDNPAAAESILPRRMSPTTRYSGVLLGTNDVVYFSVPVGSTKQGDVCSSAHDTFALWGDNASGSDFDLYVRCGSAPTPTQFTLAGQSLDTQEFVHGTSAQCPCGSSWIVAVHSYRGAGFFNLVNHKHYASEHRTQLDITHEADLTGAQIVPYQAQMTRGVRHFFGANEGARYWDTYRFRDRVTSAGEIRIHTGTGRPNSDKCGSSCGGLFADCNANLFSDWYDGPTMSHEMGHHFNCLSDEYEDKVGTECGHSIMGSQFLTNSNYCYCNLNPPGKNICTVAMGDHGFDPSPITLTALKTGPAWSNLKGRSPVAITNTPDNYDYTNFDFNGMFAVPVIVNTGNQ